MHDGLQWKIKRISFYESGQRDLPPEKLKEYQRVIVEKLKNKNVV